MIARVFFLLFPLWFLGFISFHGGAVAADNDEAYTQLAQKVDSILGELLQTFGIETGPNKTPETNEALVTSILAKFYLLRENVTKNPPSSVSPDLEKKITALINDVTQNASGDVVQVFTKAVKDIVDNMASDVMGLISLAAPILGNSGA